MCWGRESTEDNYVPDVFFMEKDKYGNEIKKVRVFFCLITDPMFW